MNSCTVPTPFATAATNDAPSGRFSRWTVVPIRGRRRRRRVGRRAFTLLEVMVAAAILALTVVMTVTLLGGARARLLRAERRWGRQRILANAAELFLVGGPNAAQPDNLLPEGFSASCELVRVEQGLTNKSSEPIHGWMLGEFRIVVRDVGGVPMADCTVQKVVREDEL